MKARFTSVFNLKMAEKWNLPWFSSKIRSSVSKIQTNTDPWLSWRIVEGWVNSKWEMRTSLTSVFDCKQLEKWNLSMLLRKIKSSFFKLQSQTDSWLSWMIAEDEQWWWEMRPSLTSSLKWKLLEKCSLPWIMSKCRSSTSEIEKQTDFWLSWRTADGWDSYRWEMRPSYPSVFNWKLLENGTLPWLFEQKLIFPLQNPNKDWLLVQLEDCWWLRQL